MTKYKGELMDCGDSLCRFALNKHGQRTNGGCRCLSRDVKAIDRIKIFKHNDAMKHLRETTMHPNVAEKLRKVVWDAILELDDIETIRDTILEAIDDFTKE